MDKAVSFDSLSIDLQLFINLVYQANSSPDRMRMQSGLGEGIVSLSQPYAEG